MSASRTRRIVLGIGAFALAVSAKIALRVGVREAAHAATTMIEGDSAAAAGEATPAQPAGEPAPAQSPAAQAADVAQGVDIQGPSATGPRAAARRVAAATDAHTAAMTNTEDASAPVGDVPAAPAAGSPAPQLPPRPAPVGGSPRQSGRSVSVTVNAAGAPLPPDESEITIVRETFAYAAAGRRDPFVSLMANGELRPMVADLRLVGVAYDPTGRNSVGIMRDITTQEQYRVKVGQTIGRMRTARIQPKQIVFTIEEFGLSRQEVLVLTPDSTTARKR